MDTVPALLAALAAQADLVRELGGDGLTAPSRCPGWSVREVLNHSLGVTSKFTAFAGGSTLSPATPVGDLVGGDPHGAVVAALAAARRAWAGADLTRECRLPFGVFTADTAAGINLVDVLAHGWDLGPVGGDGYRCEDKVWRCGLVSARLLVGPDRDPRHYGPEIAAGPGAGDEVRFLAYLGRTPEPDG